jgi:CRISPR-associated endonuclease/helicase Cas3
MYSASVLVHIQEFEFVEGDVYINLLLVVALTHHTLLSYTANGASFTFLEEAQTFFDGYKSAYVKYFNKPCHYDFLFEKTEDIQNEIEAVENDLGYIKKTQQLRSIYTYISGILNLADWLASARFSNTIPIVAFKNLPSKQQFIQHLSFDKLRKFQENLSVVSQSVLVEIPTGEGKTEGSLLWAIHNTQNTYSKIIYTLPTQTTSNKLFERVQHFFEKDECGLIHASAKIYLEKQYEHENGQVDEYFKSDFLISKSFNKPITVSTIDSLLKYFINIGRFNIATKNFLNSVIIIDEVHAYDFKLMGFLKRFLELCNENKVKVCLMSASIPKQIKNLLNIQNYPIITEVSLFKKKANVIIKKDLELDEDFESIVKKYQNGKNVIVIRNTVKSATQTYQQLKKEFDIDEQAIILYHSTFKKRDKIRKENLIFEKLKSDEPFILVATQIVEISLDIDFDVMFSDNAPIDSLIQRFGRVNRKKDIMKKGEIFIYQYRKAFPYKNSYLLNLTFETIQNGYFELGQYVEWLNIVYNRLFEDDIQIKNEISRLFDDAYQKYDDVLKKFNGIKKSGDNYDLRDIELIKNDYLLYDDFMENHIGYDDTIALPFYYEKKYRYETSKLSNYEILKLKYSFEEGVTLNDGEGVDFW